MPVSHADIPAAPLDLVPLALKSVSNQKLTLVIGTKGRFDADLMQDALRLVLLHYPILGYRLSTHTYWPTWRQMDDTNALTPLVITETPDDPQFAYNFSTCTRSMQATFLVRILRGPHNDTLTISVDHTIADIAGTKEVAYTLAACYMQLGQGLQPEILWRPPAPRNLKEIHAQISSFKKLRAVCGWRAPKGQWQFPVGDTNQRNNAIYVVRHLGDRSITHLKAYCGRYGATINDILIAALFSSLHDLHGCTHGEKFPVQFTIDLRRYLKPWHQRQAANLSSSTQVWLRKIPANPFGQTLLETHLALAEVKRKMPGVGAAIVMEMLFRLGYGRIKRTLETIFNASLNTGMANPLFINAGLIDDKRLNFGPTEVVSAHVLGPSLLTPGVAITASAFRDQLTLSTGFSKTMTDPDYISKLLDDMTGLLPAPD